MVEVVKIVLLAVSPLVLYGLALIAAAVKNRFFSASCPKCGERGLQEIDFIQGTIIVTGKRAPDSWSYERCKSCGILFKYHHGQRREIKIDERPQ